MAEIAGLVLPFFGLILLGYVTARITRQPAAAMGWLNTFIIYLALPALFFKLLAQTPVEQLARWDFVLTSMLATYVMFAIVFALAILFRRALIPDATVQGLAAAYGNLGYMGPGIAILAFGEKAAVPVALIFCFENIMHFIIAPMMMALAGDDDRPAGRLALDVLAKIAFHPFILATMAGIAAAAIQFTPPVPIERLIDYLAQAAAPCALFAMGVTLALRPLRRVPAELGYIVPIKLVLHPVLMYLAMSWVGNFEPIWIFTAVLLAALPTATNVFVIAQQYGVWIERASATVLVTTVASVVTVSTLLWLITSGTLPADLFP
ncbi:AEC family transporter [Pseudohoeflea coraliihabitans]|uniref:AEC family transporter n=1 Tax=Pseudohoeflea coraliihabitans TaxID=2860393 RepID=A0ABS6WR02_9HYPH|nr:AEC family transporter [Pseudohoeflea sp. DP4N28-3]MBW3098409.1 AEC family transporter [Pseudohoeflea sp. DP4N28-3]